MAAKCITKPLLSMIILLVPLNVFADESKNLYVICRLGNVIRTIRTLQLKDSSCQTVYTKVGIDRIVARGKNWQSCQDILDNIIVNLEKASWKCRKVAQSVEIIRGKSEPKSAAKNSDSSQ